ncbi:winged helix-turn-helix transcriptional regulator [Herbidospora daliensis]|uniref:winged helix-turn-helix transcriptional regulator n=1 Tax=Herbidospora daliensis TaxID=295585 RepID=UPI000782EC1C|nr:helix-turn-helix domain-containing protein [Herbidospora daliensis]
MTRRDYGQYCGLARALEIVGERWALLIVRDLLVRPLRYTDLVESLPGIPTNVLATRLKELEQAGIVERRLAPAPKRGVLYALTAAGIELQPALLALGRWGASQMGDPEPGEIIRPELMTISFRAAFDARAARGVHAVWEVHVHDVVLHLVVDDGELVSGVGPAPREPDLVITFGPDGLPSYRALMRAARAGEVVYWGRPESLDTFLRVFTLTEPAKGKTG